MACLAENLTRGTARRRCPPPLLRDLGEMGAQRQGLTHNPSVPVHRQESLKKRLRRCPETCLVSGGCLQNLQVGGSAFLCERPVTRSAHSLQSARFLVQVLWQRLLLSVQQSVQAGRGVLACAGLPQGDVCQCQQAEQVCLLVPVAAGRPTGTQSCRLFLLHPAVPHWLLYARLSAQWSWLGSVSLAQVMPCTCRYELTVTTSQGL